MHILEVSGKIPLVVIREGLGDYFDYDLLCRSKMERGNERREREREQGGKRGGESDVKYIETTSEGSHVKLKALLSHSCSICQRINSVALL